jgi:hypothetical protein
MLPERSPTPRLPLSGCQIVAPASLTTIQSFPSGGQASACRSVRYTFDSGSTQTPFNPACQNAPIPPVTWLSPLRG